MRYILAIFLGFFFIGCTHQSADVVSIYPFEPNPMKIHKSASIEKVFLKGVKDLRIDKHILGTYELDGKDYLVQTDTDIHTWFYRALESAIEYEGLYLSNEQSVDTREVAVAIKALNARYVKNKMTTEIYLEVSYKCNHKKNTETIRFDLQDYYHATPSKREFEDSIYHVLRTSVNKIAQKLASLK